MKERTLSIIIDEFKNFETYDSININDTIESFKFHIANIGYPNPTFHAYLLIRRDGDNYFLLDRGERKKLFTSLFHLAKKLPSIFIFYIKRFIGMQ